jgi:hypothetical protein
VRWWPRPLSMGWWIWRGRPTGGIVAEGLQRVELSLGARVDLSVKLIVDRQNK